jgi:hypothetical protein
VGKAGKKTQHLVICDVAVKSIPARIFRVLVEFYNATLKAFDRVTPGALLVSTLAVFLMLAIAILVFSLIPNAGKITADVKTQSWSIELAEGDPFPNFLHGLVETPEFVPQTCQLERSEITFADAATSKVTLRFGIEPKNKIAVRIEPNSNQLAYAFIDCGEETNELLGVVRLVYPLSEDGRRVILGRGKISLGSLPVADPTGDPKLLLSGKISASSRSFPFRTGRVEETSELLLGDTVRFYDTLDRAEETNSDLVAVFSPEQRVFNVVLHSRAITAEVNQLGSVESYPISNTPSIWARIQAQPIWAILVAIFALLLNIVAAIRHYIELKQY